jgi:hypothetical protein
MMLHDARGGCVRGDARTTHVADARRLAPRRSTVCCGARRARGGARRSAVRGSRTRRGAGRSPVRRLIWCARGAGARGGGADVVDDAFARGNQAAAAGDLQAAVRHYEEAERLLPGRSAVLSFNLGTAYAQLGELGLATHHLRTGVAGPGAGERGRVRGGAAQPGDRSGAGGSGGGGQRGADRPAGDVARRPVRGRRRAGVRLAGSWVRLAGARAVAAARAPGPARPGRGDHQRGRRAGGDLPGGRRAARVRGPLGGRGPAGDRGRRPSSRCARAPGSHRKVMFVVQGGSRVRVVDRGAGWLRIRLPDGLEGWAPQADLRTSTEVPRRPQGSG